MKIRLIIERCNKATTGTLYLVSNDMRCSAERLYEVYQKRWRIEEYLPKDPPHELHQDENITKHPIQVFVIELKEST